MVRQNNTDSMAKALSDSITASPIPFPGLRPQLSRIPIPDCDHSFPRNPIRTTPQFPRIPFPGLRPQLPRDPIPGLRPQFPRDPIPGNYDHNFSDPFPGLRTTASPTDPIPGLRHSFPGSHSGTSTTSFSDPIPGLRTQSPDPIPGTSTTVSRISHSRTTTTASPDPFPGDFDHSFPGSHSRDFEQEGNGRTRSGSSLSSFNACHGFYLI
ncbi:hypothetical protein BV898_19329 [Hypsibius exemplaris]|uniref:Uncharacterized protein n=1 Tax=Hypsibius exemplaris TaxID=2072580 RepID=A0A9X6NIV2_HYPEX|nr:hypothetical protein BV898_19329 [Hypsibius exemplaris]